MNGVSGNATAIGAVKRKQQPQNERPWRIRGMKTIPLVCFSFLVYFLSQSLQFLMLKTPSSAHDLEEKRLEAIMMQPTSPKDLKSIQDKQKYLLASPSSGLPKEKFGNFAKQGQRVEAFKRALSDTTTTNNNNNNNRNMTALLLQSGMQAEFENRLRDFQRRQANKKNAVFDKLTALSASKKKGPMPTHKHVVNTDNNNNNSNQQKKKKTPHQPKELTTTKDNSAKQSQTKKTTETAKKKSEETTIPDKTSWTSVISDYLKNMGVTSQDTNKNKKPAYKPPILKKPVRKPRRMKCQQDEILASLDPSRVPGYMEGCSNTTYYGYVMRDLASRLFHHPVPPSNVLVVGPNVAGTVARHHSNNATWDEGTMQKHYNYNVAKSFALSALHHRHHVIGIDSHVDDSWWSKQTDNITQQQPFLLAVLDPVIGDEDGIVERASTFLGSAAVKYVVYRVSASASGIGFHGVNATALLEGAGYKIQVLSASHAHPSGGGNDTRTFPPNTLLSSKDNNKNDMHSYLTFGSQLAMDAEGSTGIFRSYLFATKGLDLAIPSHRQYINVTGHADDYILDPKKIPYKSCPASTARVDFPEDQNVRIRCHGQILSETEMTLMTRHGQLWFSTGDPMTSEAVCVQCPAGDDGNDAERTSNVACNTRFIPPNTTATTSAASKKKTLMQHLLVIHLEKMSRQQFDKYFPLTQTILNETFIGFDNYYSIGDSQANYNALFGGGKSDNSTLSDNSTTHGREWLWDVLQRRGYNVLKASNRCTRPTGSHPSTAPAQGNSNETLPSSASSYSGSQISEMFCFAFDRPNCLGRAHTAKRLLAHANRFLRYHTKNKLPTATILTLADGHEDTGLLPGLLDKELHSILSSIRERLMHMKTTIVIVSEQGMDYGPYFKSLPGLQESIQPVFYVKPVFSGHGRILERNRNMHITPFDIYETLLQMTPFKSAKKSSSMAKRSLLEEGYNTSTKTEASGFSLVRDLHRDRALCSTTKAIPDAYCGLMASTEEEEKRLALDMPSPPSILSFYADIPRYHRHHVMTIEAPKVPQRAMVTTGCLCATNVRPWFECKPNRHPWGPKPNSNRSMAMKEYFMLVDCPGKPTHFEIEMVPNPSLMNKTRDKLSGFPDATFPNILFIELDSTSVDHADRHFPKTRELLKRYRVQSSEEGYSCPFGFCSADFSSHASLAGSSSIPNQVAALGGCVSAPFDFGMCGLNFTTDIGQNCNDTADPRFGLRLERARVATGQTFWCPPRLNSTHPKTPWLPAIAERLGYVNYFGEELCYEGSPYVTQGNVFPSFYQDIEPHIVFCRLAGLRIRKEQLDMGYMYRWALEKPDEPCIGGFECGMKKNRIALDLLQSTWDTYKDRPKLAFLNSGAAHVYSYDQARLHVLAEYYDDELSSFLESMLSRSDANSTIILIRSDHGLQKGPMAMEYSTQVEHNRPWTEILVPESLPGISKQAMSLNQNRLTSSHDLYRTLRDAMEHPLKKQHVDVPLPPVPGWSKNLLDSEIPIERSCQEARVDTNLCREKTIKPTLGVCNILDHGQNLFCQDMVI